ncbi:hypothetical protein [Culicoidibacter larvae]|uniref:Uncharacterized protein n=1 Tax=Culicoidibacter larvae TaxID=2579976 RepID=A0A5R8Q6M2_9FIRM|nr:hypothetical protein [Culicoidibacter larvae]TLG70300.1 hypothetical protein FEZ08_11840 [Culicoidibacter larvae]
MSNKEKTKGKNRFADKINKENQLQPVTLVGKQNEIEKEITEVIPPAQDDQDDIEILVDIDVDDLKQTLIKEKKESNRSSQSYYMHNDIHNAAKRMAANMSRGKRTISTGKLVETILAKVFEIDIKD